MPAMTGPEIQERLAAEAPGLPVIFITGEAPVPLETLRCGTVDVLSKPLDVNVLPTTIRRALQQADASPPEHRSADRR